MNIRYWIRSLFNFCKPSALLRKEVSFLVNPFKTLLHYCTFIRFFTCLYTTGGNGQIVRHLRAVNGIILFKAMHLLYLGLFPPPSELERAFHFDAFYIMLPLTEYNLLSILLCVLCLYSNWFLINGLNIKLLTTLKRILLSRKNDFFTKNVTQNRNAGKRTQRFFCIVLRILESITLNNELFLILINIYFPYKLYQNWASLVKDEGAYRLLLFRFPAYLLSATSYCILMIILPFALTINQAPMYTYIYMFYLKSSLAYRKIVSLIIKKQKRLTAAKYETIKSQVTGTLVFFCSVNRMFSGFFLTYLAVFMPVNILFTVWIFLGFITKAENLFIAVVYLLDHALTILIFHLVVAKSSARIHRPVGLLFRWAVVNQNRKKTLVTKLKLSNDISALNTQNRYGFTYGNTGLVSLFAFAKYLLLHSRILMLTYKTLRE